MKRPLRKNIQYNITALTGGKVQQYIGNTSLHSGPRPQHTGCVSPVRRPEDVNAGRLVH